MSRHACVEVDLGAVTTNVRSLARLAPDARLCAVVKADGYGHGSVAVARAALAGGASWLAVALVSEGEVLRAAGVNAPVLLLSEPPVEAMERAFRSRLTPMLYTPAGIDAAARAGGSADRPWSVHLKIDTGMHRVGADAGDAVDLARCIAGHETLHLGGTATHLAVADEPERPENREQLDRFAALLDELRRSGIDPGLCHAANSAGLIAHPAARLDMVRAGIAVYGIPPAPGLAGSVELHPAMSVRAQVTMVRSVPAGDGLSYGLRHVFDHPARVAVVPLGYADGVPRRLSATGGEVLIGGVRRPIRGVVTMDQLMVEVTDEPAVVPGDEVVLIGRQGDQVVTAQEWAERLGTIAYEIVCGFGPRLDRRHTSEGRPV
jgi:alanine racemase